MSNSVFPALSLDRKVSKWESQLVTLTPAERRGKRYYKREDFFAPLGYGGINGAKLRQCIWLTQTAVEAGATAMFTGASVKSPQLSMGTAVARHFGIPSTLVIGSPSMATAIGHPNVFIASLLGAEFRHADVAYNPALQKMTRELAAQAPHPFILEYGISIDKPEVSVEAFHRLGAEQVRNFPSDVEELVLPAGSCNTCVSVLYGLAIFMPKALKRVTLFGIGPTKLDWIDKRLQIIERVSGNQIRKLFFREFHHHAELAADQNDMTGIQHACWRLEHYDLHATRFATYQDERPYTLDGIELHPTYEGKVATYLNADRTRFEWFWKGGKSMFWIVGSRPDPEVMIPQLRPLVDAL